MNATQFKIALGATIVAGAAIGIGRTVSLEGQRLADAQAYKDQVSKMSPDAQLILSKQQFHGPPDVRESTVLGGLGAIGLTAALAGSVEALNFRIDWATAGSGFEIKNVSNKVPLLLLAGAAAATVGSMATIGVLNLQHPDK